MLRHVKFIKRIKNFLTLPNDDISKAETLDFALFYLPEAIHTRARKELSGNFPVNSHA